MTLEFLQFIYYCNQKITNDTDYYIANTIIDRIDQVADLSIEEVAEISHVSMSSVSRFINKAGFKSFQEFKRLVSASAKNLYENRLSSNLERFAKHHENDMMDEIFDSVINNMEMTKKTLDRDALKSIIKQIKKSKHVTFIGDNHELGIFYPLQLDLLANGISASMVNIYDFEKRHYLNMDKGDTIITITVFDRWFIHVYNSGLNSCFAEMKNMGIQLIGFGQEKDSLKDYFDTFYTYGVKDSFNEGYFSLHYLQEVLSELVYMIK